MKRSTILLLLLVLVAAGVLYYFLRQAEAPAPGAAPSLISLLPANSTYVFYADAAVLRASPFVQKLLAALPSPKEERDYAEFVRRTGFDYTRDLDRVAVAVMPTDKGDVVLAVAEGRFDRQRISEYASSSPRLVGNYGDTLVFSTGERSAAPPSKKREEILLGFISENRILLAQGVDAKQSLTFSREPPPISSNAPLNERIARVAGSEFFAVGHVNPLPTNLLPRDIVSGELKKTLDSIQWITFASRPAGDTLGVVVEAECASAADAKKLAWSLEGLRVLASAAGGALADPKSMKGSDPALAALFQTILKDGKLSSAERFVRLSFSLGPDFLAALQPRPPSTPKKPTR
jgi:hypothetical protein